MEKVFLSLAESSRIDGLPKCKEDGKTCLEGMERLAAERRLQKEDSGGDQNTLAFLDTSGLRESGYTAVEEIPGGAD